MRSSLLRPLPPASHQQLDLVRKQRGVPPHLTADKFRDKWGGLTTVRVYHQTDGTKPGHVYLAWENETAHAMPATELLGNQPLPVHTVLHLSRHEQGDWFFEIHPGKMRNPYTLKKEKSFFVGTYLPEQRRELESLAAEIRFYPHSTVNTCRTWMRDFLIRIRDHPVLGRDLRNGGFDRIDQDVPLLKRKPEKYCSEKCRLDYRT